MMVSANFPVLYRGTRLDLGPIWDALVQTHSPEQLLSTFLKFETALGTLGVEVTLPPAVVALSQDEREREKQTFNGGVVNYATDASGHTPLLTLEPAPDFDPNALK